MNAISTIRKGIARPLDFFVAQQQTPMARQLVTSFLGLGSPKYPMDIALRNGGSVRVCTRGELKVFWSIFVQKCYRLWRDCQSIVDAGANIGVFSVWAARQLPQAQILSLEPFPETFARLQHNLRTNHFGPRVQSVQLALAGQSGERQMKAGEESQRRSLVPTDRAEGEAVKVPSITLAELFDRYSLEQIDLLKMDIEGSEWEVLFSTPPFILSRIRRLQLEYHEVHARFGYSKAQLFAHLAEAGLKLTHCVEDRHGTGIAVFEQERGERSWPGSD
jgi:FkbM family methyltransferase